MLVGTVSSGTVHKIQMFSPFVFFLFTDLQDTTLALDFRVTVLEENGGSVAELEVRVEELEGTAANHETRISAVEADVNGTKYISYLFINSGTYEVLSAESVPAQKFKSGTFDSKAKTIQLHKSHTQKCRRFTSVTTHTNIWLQQTRSWLYLSL